MLKEAKLAMRIVTDAYDGEIVGLLEAGARDLEIAGVVLPGTVSFAETENGVQDNSTLTDNLCRRAVITYARMHFGSPDDFERLQGAYEIQKVQLMHAGQYTRYGCGGEGGDCEW